MKHFHVLKCLRQAYENFYYSSSRVKFYSKFIIFCRILMKITCKFTIGGNIKNSGINLDSFFDFHYLEVSRYFYL